MIHNILTILTFFPFNFIFISINFLNLLSLSLSNYLDHVIRRVKIILFVCSFTESSFTKFCDTERPITVFHRALINILINIFLCQSATAISCRLREVSQNFYLLRGRFTIASHVGVIGCNRVVIAGWKIRNPARPWKSFDCRTIDPSYRIDALTRQRRVMLPEII